MNKVFFGDCRKSMKQLIADGVKVQMCVTSPPYYGLRDYGHPNQLGLEETPEQYIANMVEVFRLVKDLLADDGVLWLNLGSSYFGSGKGRNGDGSVGKINSATQKSNHGSLFSDGKQPNLSRSDVPACGIDSKEPQDLSVPDFSYSGLCDECLTGYQNHLQGIVHNGLFHGQSSQLDEQTNHDTEHLDLVPNEPAVFPHGVQVSTSLESWLQLRGACSRCDSRASALEGFGLTYRGALASSHSSVCMNDKAQTEMTSADHIVDKESLDLAWWGHYTSTFKQKDLIPIPWMVAMALQMDGWILRQDIIWHKPNPMPESVTDRCTKSHEYIFMLSKSQRYFYDNEAIKEPAIYFDKDPRPPGIVRDREYGYDSKQAILQNRKPVYKDARSFDGKHTDKQRGHIRRHAGFNDRWDAMSKEEQCGAMRNKRSVWTIATKPYSGAHFAVFPEELIEPCILAGSRVGDVVLDPFFGSGTTGQVSQNLGRQWIGCELNRDYEKLQNNRLSQMTMAKQWG